MRRLLNILSVTGITILIVVALSTTALRIMLPQLNTYRPQLMAKIQSITGITVDIGYLHANWTLSGPTLELHNSALKLPYVNFQANKATLALNVWQSLLHWRWQFQDIRFHQLQVDFTASSTQQENNSLLLQLNKIRDIFLYQVNHFDLRTSRISFLTSSGTKTVLVIPQFTWYKTHNRQRAEGKMNLVTVNPSERDHPHQFEQSDHSVIQVRIDIDNRYTMPANGVVYLQADHIDIKPWIDDRLQKQVGLENAKLSIASWLKVKDGIINDMTLLFKEGQAIWQVDENKHQVALDNLIARIQRKNNGWQLHLPELNLITDHQAWPKGSLSAFWLPANNPLIGEVRQEELRIRTTQLALDRLRPFLPALTFVLPSIPVPLSALRLHGQIAMLALDIPLKQPEKTRFHVKWQDIGWKHQGLLPGIDHFSGTLTGSMYHGRLTLDLKESTLPYGNKFRAPLVVNKASGSLEWQNNETGLELWSDDLDIQAKSLWVNGDFRYQQPIQGPPWLTVLAGLRLYDARDAWRYFPSQLMGDPLTDYLNAALQGGKVDNASLIYHGNPHDFPYKNNEGHFKVEVPLRNATFQFQPDWPALTGLAVNLDFINDGLWMHAAQATLGQVTGSHITAMIPEYLAKKLLIDAVVAGKGQDIQAYFRQTPLKNSVGTALDELQVSGKVHGNFHLDIPLRAGQETRASGEVRLNNNHILIKSLASKIENVSGKFRFDNANLQGDRLSATWLMQPLSIDFSAKNKQKNYFIDIDLQGKGQIEKLPGIAASFGPALTGSMPWQGKVALQLPDNAMANYKVDIRADLKEVSSRLPSPLAKKSGQPLALTIGASGDLHAFTLAGSAGKTNHFNSHWIVKNQQINLVRAIWQMDSKKILPLPASKKIILDFPPLDGERWLAFLIPRISGMTHGKNACCLLPVPVMLRTPALFYAGQSWQQLSLLLEQQPDVIKLTAKGQQIDGTLLIPRLSPWRADIHYLYWQLAQLTENSVHISSIQQPFNRQQPFFKDWPALILRCQECWVMGKYLKRIEADLKPQGHSLLLERGLIDMGVAQLTLDGRWQRDIKGEQTVLKGKMTGPQFDQMIAFWGTRTPLKQTPFNIDFDLNWYGLPWKPPINRLNGTLTVDFGKGKLDNVAGRTGQLLRLVSIDALLRKLRLDFSDTFSHDFLFDSIYGTAWLSNGVLHTKDLLIDGLSADLAMEGYVDLVQRQINIKIIVAPDISATVGVATAFVTMNPAVGAAAFAATRVLAPIWNKISLIRYLIIGSLDQPQIHEVLRQVKKEKAP